jgi:hypothetical protein
MRLAAKGDDEANGIIDEDFLRALEYAYNVRIRNGMDRLMMFLTNNASIQEVLCSLKCDQRKTNTNSRRMKSYCCYITNGIWTSKNKIRFKW